MEKSYTEREWKCLFYRISTVGLLQIQTQLVLEKVNFITYVYKENKYKS